MKTLRFVAFLLALPLLSGCATNAMTGRSQLSLVSEEAAITKASKLYDSMIEAYGKDGKVSNDEALNDRVRIITNRLIEQAVLYKPDAKKWAWQTSVVEDPNINASCMPGGKIVVLTGLIEKVEPTDDELAQVMGHEISHAIANHGAEKMSVQLMADLAVVVVTAAANRNQKNQQAVHNAAALAALAFINLPNSRNAEEEADKLGIELAARAGYDPRAAVSLWEKMMQKTGQTSRFDFLHTHPSPPKRIESQTALQEPMLKIYEERKPFYASYTPSHYYVMAGNPVVYSTEEEGAKLSDDDHAESGKALVFYSAQFEAFKAGSYEFTCSKECSFKFFLNQSALNQLYVKQDWRLLAQEVLKIGYKLDLAYYYLGVSAEGLGFREAAKNYYVKAVELSSTNDDACSKGVMIKCNDLEVQSLANAAIGGL